MTATAVQGYAASMAPAPHSSGAQPGPVMYQGSPAGVPYNQGMSAGQHQGQHQGMQPAPQQVGFSQPVFGAQPPQSAVPAAGQMMPQYQQGYQPQQQPQQPPPQQQQQPPQATNEVELISFD